jgi:hypothetical protein
MSETIKFKISSSVAVYARPGVSAAQKLAGLEAASTLVPIDRVTLLFCLMKDTDAAVKSAAATLFSELSDDVILQYVTSAESHPSLLDALARVHHARPWVVQALLGNKLLSGPAREFLQGQMLLVPENTASAVVDGGHGDQCPTEDLALVNSVSDVTDEADDINEVPENETLEVNEEDEQFQSKYKVAMVLGISEKIKMALSGDKEWRSILIKDANKLVSGSVIKNPRITDSEILTILKVGVQNDEIIRLICANKEWTKSYLIRKALIDCPKTPLPNSLRYLTLLNEKDIANYAKSKNISSVLSTQAKRLLLAKKR